MNTNPRSERATSSARSLVHALVIIAVLVQPLVFAAVCAHDLFDVSAFAMVEDLVARVLHKTQTTSHTASMTIEFQSAGADADREPPARSP